MWRILNEVADVEMATVKDGSIDVLRKYLPRAAWCGVGRRGAVQPGARGSFEAAPNELTSPQN